jgi:DNA invertase Pin-like site-specific DNA recombinase
MAVAIYVRVSTEEQRERQSIMTQPEFGERPAPVRYPLFEE